MTYSQLQQAGRWLLLSFSLGLGVTLASPAASVVWNTRALISSETDVATNGGLVYAYDDSDLATTVNGITFAAGNSSSSLGGNVTVSGSYWYSTTAFGSASGTPWSALSAAYQTMLQGGVYATSNTTMTVTLNNLTAGHQYLVQLWVCDTRSGASNRSETVTSPGGNSVSLDYNNTSANGGVGQYAIGSFTADATTQPLWLTNAQPPVVGSSAQMNAIQVRDLSAPNGSVLANVTLTPGTKYQIITGIGGNLAGGEQGPFVAAGGTVLTNAFSPGGLNLSFIRMDNPYGQTEPAFTNLADDNNYIMSAFRSLQPAGKIMMTSWSPPGSLKSTGSAFEGTLAKNTQGQFVYTNFANWWVSSLKYWQSNSTVPDYVSIQNEPDWYPTSGTNNAWQAGCELTPTEGTYASYTKAFNATVSALQANGLGGVKLIAPDPSGTAGNSVQNYLTNLPAGSFSAASHHPYGNGISTNGASLLATLDSQYPWSTTLKFMDEYDGDNWGTNYPDWIGLAVTMHNVFTIENADAYLVWSLYYGLFYYSNGAPATDKYYPVGHYSKFIFPGDRRVAATSTSGDLLVSAYVHTNRAGIDPRYVLVMINTGGSTLTTTLNTGSYWSADPLQSSWRVWQTANTDSGNYRLTSITNLQGAALTNQNQSLVLPAYSLTTAVINNGLASNPTNLVATVTNGGLNLTWPADHWGWILQVQTNTLKTGLGTNWVDQSNSMYTTSFFLPLAPGTPTVFSRLRHP